MSDPLRWEKVYIFISSTFNDMHGERDYLVKRVFPELREWCERRRLRLLDIDLRWGVTEQDATENKNVVKVCLSRIDQCRPFFLCFMGQRRGWIPDRNETSRETFESFPELGDYIGAYSVTELEILHALLHPMHGTTQDETERYEPVQCAFFYLRDPSYIRQLPAEPSQLLRIYLDEERENQEQLSHWREVAVPNTGRPIRNYTALWDPNASTPEIAIPLQCPSLNGASIERWRRQLESAGIVASGLDVEEDPEQANQARRFNALLTRGRLSEFQVSGEPLASAIVADLKDAILWKFPSHIEITSDSALQEELDQQDYFLLESTEGFIERNAFVDLDLYVASDSKSIFVLTAHGGMGKSMLLANWVEHYRISHQNTNSSILFRFIGASDRSTTINSLLRFLVLELKEKGKWTGELPDDPVKLRSLIPTVLEGAGRHGQIVIVLDALNQLESGLSDIDWLPASLPDNVYLIISFTRGTDDAEELRRSLKEDPGFVVSDLQPFENPADRRRLADGYLSQYLKELDEQHSNALIHSEGAANPLYLKVVLSEIRVFGGFGGIAEKIRTTFGHNPVSAFQALLKRLETDPVHVKVEPADLVPLMFGLLAHARGGFSIEELTDLITADFHRTGDSVSPVDIQDALHFFFRQVRSFVKQREGRYEFFYESFKTAALNCYSGEQYEGRTRPDSEWHAMIARFLEGKGETHSRTLRDYVFHLIGAADTRKLKQCFEQGFMRKREIAGASLDEIHTDSVRSREFFRKSSDLEGMLMVTSFLYSGAAQINLFKYESFLVWKGQVVANEDDRAEMRRVISYVENQSAGFERLRMTAELLIGFGGHPLANPFRTRHQRQLEQILNDPSAPEGLNILVAEALGHIDTAFQLALSCSETERIKLSRILKLICRHRDHPKAPVVLDGLLAQKWYPKNAISAVACIGLLPASLETDAVWTTAVKACTEQNTRAALQIASYLADTPNMLLELLGRDAERASDFPMVQLGLLYLAWFDPECRSRDLVEKLVKHKSKRHKPIHGLANRRGKVLQAHFRALMWKPLDETKDKASYLGDETILIPLSSVWAKLISENAGMQIPDFRTLSETSNLAPSYDPIFTTTGQNLPEWIELGIALNNERMVDQGAGLLKQLYRILSEQKTQKYRRFGTIFLIVKPIVYLIVGCGVLYPVVYLLLTGHYLAGFLLLLILYILFPLIMACLSNPTIRAKVFNAVATIPSLFGLLPGLINAHWQWARNREASNSFVEKMESMKGIRAGTAGFLRKTRLWQRAAISLLNAGRPDLAFRLISTDELSTGDFLCEWEPRWWRRTEHLTGFLDLLLYVNEAHGEEREDWRGLAEELQFISTSDAELPLAEALRLSRTGQLDLLKYWLLLQKLVAGDRTVVKTEKQAKEIAEFISKSSKIDANTRLARRLRFASQDLRLLFADEILKAAVLHSRKTFAELLYIIGKWKGLGDRRSLTRVRKEYIGVAEENLLPSAAHPLLFTLFRWGYLTKEN
jgi:hypothetical protein